MRALFSALVFLASPHFAHAQAFVNFPPDAVSGTTTLTFDSYSPSDTGPKKSRHAWGQLNSSDSDQPYGILICDSARLKAHPTVNGLEEHGYFDFENADACDKVARTMLTYPNHSVRFTLSINPAKQNRDPGYRGGEVIGVEWLEGTSKPAVPQVQERAAAPEAPQAEVSAPASPATKVSCWCKAIRNMSFGGGEQTGTVAVRETCPADGVCQQEILRKYGGHAFFGIGTGQGECQSDINNGTFDNCGNE